MVLGILFLTSGLAKLQIYIYIFYFPYSMFRYIEV